MQWVNRKKKYFNLKLVVEKKYNWSILRYKQSDVTVRVEIKIPCFRICKHCHYWRPQDPVFSGCWDNLFIYWPVFDSELADNLIFQNNLYNVSKTVTIKSGNSIVFCIDRIVVLCSSWKSCPETSAEMLCRTLFQCFQDIIQLTVTAQL